MALKDTFKDNSEALADLENRIRAARGIVDPETVETSGASTGVNPESAARNSGIACTL